MEDTQRNETAEILEDMLRDANKLPRRGAEVVQKGDGDLPVPMIMSKVDSAGVVWLYDTRTGEPNKCLTNLVPIMLRKKREDGSHIWTLKQPPIPWKAGGDYKCLLHQDNPNRKHYDELGLPVCRKANLTSPYQVQRHMQKRHKTAWATLEQERIAREKAEERKFQEELLTKVAAAGTGTEPKPKTKRKKRG